MDPTQALEAIEERRNADKAFLTKDDSPQPFTKADTESGILEGEITRYWVVDSYGECTAPGAFTKSIADRGPKGANRIYLRYEHETTIGMMTEMTETDLGVSVKALVVDDGSDGSTVRKHLAAGVPYGMSIGFNRIASRPATESDPLIWDYAPGWIKQMAMSDLSMVTVLTEVKNLENSVVTFPAVDNALVTDYRSALDLTAKAIDRLAADIKAGRLTDDHLTHIRRLVADLPAAIDPKSGETPPSVENQTAVVAKRNYLAEFSLLTMNAGIELEGLSL